MSTRIMDDLCYQDWVCNPGKRATVDMLHSLFIGSPTGWWLAGLLTFALTLLCVWLQVRSLRSPSRERVMIYAAILATVFFADLGVVAVMVGIYVSAPTAAG